MTFMSVIHRTQQTVRSYLRVFAHRLSARIFLRPGVSCHQVQDRL
jgi:hypothetical protein